MEKVVSKLEHQMEELFIKKLNSCEKVKNEKYPDSVFFKCQDRVLFEQDNENKFFWVRYSIVWSVFEHRFKLSCDDVELFIKGMVEKHLKLEGFTPNYCMVSNHSRWKSI